MGLFSRQKAIIDAGLETVEYVESLEGEVVDEDGCWRGIESFKAVHEFKDKDGKDCKIEMLWTSSYGDMFDVQYHVEKY
jgi:hypothetical protein